jgi:hypothetical protein
VTVALVGHEGSFVGSRTTLGCDPDTGITVAVHADVEDIGTTALAGTAIGLDGHAGGTA